MRHNAPDGLGSGEPRQVDAGARQQTVQFVGDWREDHDIVGESLNIPSWKRMFGGIYRRLKNRLAGLTDPDMRCHTPPFLL
jgi:hypothetical protein